MQIGDPQDLGFSIKKLLHLVGHYKHYGYYLESRQHFPTLGPTFAIPFYREPNLSLHDK